MFEWDFARSPLALPKGAGHCKWKDWLQALIVTSFPGVALALFYGQNSLITTAIAAAALVFLESSPILSGVFLSALAIKPQLALLFPVALACGRHWKVLAVASVATGAYIGSTVGVFGLKVWQTFLEWLPRFNQAALEHGGPKLLALMPTVFAASRLFGLSVTSAYWLHAAVAIPAIFTMAYLWFVRARFELRCAALCVATLLAQPYLLHYDLAWLAVPIALLLRDRKSVPLDTADRVVIIFAWLLPGASFVTVALGLPGYWRSAALVALLVVIVRRHVNTLSEANSQVP
ncbi:glycosyltransferase family 87 protein [Pandoraea pnomenusa]|uniref:glycosyltransferase family 87 protein n=1 Tax=Pandoraea pnomenusa TaxID=93220 RepID=UPI001146210B|nr:glycosyltransferase family 87 protein [Pandoraea pnomenusa]QDH60178.1 DUF2029 domain-containing protein [Pandoraea pnomenusa]